MLIKSYCKIARNHLFAIAVGDAELASNAFSHQMYLNSLSKLQFCSSLNGCQNGMFNWYS
ncbi:uncharacterized protein PHALS_10181 [Plasmopara halstedii]|uniref:Uncharacterized protein n=1 Tax=Plasmopara halstedii TaxID=4781 RepID=A0A0P1AFT8_PLAHL|nr:uncharacterized protein PHALS_10181 [Plasmopara halstedii]CEG39956.1 hypothetical protein PHALS_10181 [Plasmopara halstedii]|eukprot:XP_024576325.1 hypothetical protein PHALS_10181 [Plasmopara halstedii]